MELNDLRGERGGQHALLVAGGPSGKRWKELAEKILPDFIICLNGAIVGIAADELGKSLLDYWLFMDYDPPVPDWVDKAAAVKNVCKVVSRPMATVFGGSITARTSTTEPDVRRSLHGLRMWPAVAPGTRLTGTTSANALHLAGILGCSRVSSVGIDLCFDSGQHWYHCREYGVHPTMSGGEMEPRAFVVNGKRVVSCKWFIESGKRLIEYREQLTAANMDWRDYSGGLLQAMGMDNPEQVKQT
jgi:hypothetical protein